jgi:WS/DGAT/MGAT family acyltransferase
MKRSRLSSLDASFLRVETAAAHMHVGWKGVFAPRADGKPITVDALRAAVSGRLRHDERFRQRLAFPLGGMAEPVWVDDERFDVAHHVVGLSEPGETVSRSRFDELADLVLSEPLDRARALWRVHLVPRLSDGGVGLVMKAHHAMVDGKSAVELALLLLDVSPDAAAPEPDAAWRPRRAPGSTRLALEALVERGGEPLRMAGGMARLAASPDRGVRLAGTLRRAALAVGEDLARPAPASHVNVPIGPRRTLVHHATPIEQLLEVKRRRGVTLNDVALAAVAGALRQIALLRRTIPTPLKVMIPVSVRSDEEAASLGNRISFVFIELPCAEPDPAARLAAVHRATAQRRRDREAEDLDVAFGVIARAPTPIQHALAHAFAHPRLFNLTVSTVAGPAVPRYLRGCRLRTVHSAVPLAGRHALSIGVVMVAGQACFGLTADARTLPEADADALAGDIDAEIDALLSA